MTVGQVIAKLGVDPKEYEKGLRKAETQANKAGSKIGSIFKQAFSVTLGMGMFKALEKGFKATISTAIDFNSMLQTAQIGFTTLLGSAEKAQAFLDDMADFAAKTPFGYEELLEASKKMLAYGFSAENVLPTLRAVGDATAALGMGSEGIDRVTLALGQILAKGKLSGEEMRQLTEAGIPAWHMLAEAMGKTVPELQDMVSKGLIPGYKAVEMLTAGMTKRFGGMMQSMENTWQGVTSSIKDIWRMTIGAVTQNLFQGVVSWLQKVRDFATGFYDTFRQYGLQRAISESFGPEVAAMVSVLGATLRGLASVVSAVTGFITQYGKQIKFAAIVMGTYLALTKAVTLAKQIMIAVTAVERGQLLAKIPVLNVVSTAMGIYRVQMALAAQQGVVLTGVIAKLRVALYSLWSALGPIGWIILGLSAAVGGGTHLWGKYTQSVYSGAKVHDELAEGIDQVEGSAGGAAGAIEDEADAMKKAGKAADKNLQSFDEVHQLQEDMAGSAEDLAKSMGLDDTELGVPDAGGFEIPDIGAQLEEMKPTLAGFWEWIKQGAGNLWETVKQKWSEFVNWVKSWDVWDWIGQKWESLKNLASTTWAGIADVASTAWNGVVNVTQTIWQEIWNLLQAYWSNTAQLATDVFGAIWDFIKGTWDNIKTTTSNIWGAIWEFLKSQWETIKTFGGNIFGILGDLITGKIDLRTAVNQIWGEINNFFFSSWSNIRDFGINIWTALRDFFINQWSLIQGVAIAIWTAIKGFFVGNWEATKEAATSIWTAIKDFFSQTWEAIETAVVEYWTAILEFLGINWETTKQKASEIWQSIRETITNLTANVRDRIIDIWSRTKDRLLELWEGIKQGAKEKWDGVRTVIKGAINGIIGFINKFIREFNKIEIKVPSITIPFVGTVGGWSVRVPQIPEIPMLAKGGLVMDPTLAMLGEAGPEAVIPLGRSGFAGDLADTVAQAVYQAIMDAIRISQASSPQSSDAKELVLKIDNTVLARMQLPALTREAQRQGFDLVLKSQGV